jgi:hypothetical protein
MRATYDPNEHAAVYQVARAADWFQADGWLGQDREDGITIATPRPQGLRVRLASGCDVGSHELKRSVRLFSHLHRPESRLLVQGPDVGSCASLRAGVRWERGRQRWWQ